MTQLIPENHIQVSFGYDATGDPELAYTTIGFETTGFGGAGALNSFAQAVWDSWQIQMKGVTATAWNMTGAFYLVGATSPPYVRIDLPGSTNGTGSTQALPNNCAALIKKATTTAGRQGRGRMYVPGLALNAAGVNGVLDGNEKDLWQDAIDSWATDVQALALFVDFALFHDEAGPITDPSTIITLTVDNKIATQRRRMRS